jgi:hypothetical protein
MRNENQNKLIKDIRYIVSEWKMLSGDSDKVKDS